MYDPRTAEGWATAHLKSPVSSLPVSNLHVLADEPPTVITPLPFRCLGLFRLEESGLILHCGDFTCILLLNADQFF